MSGASLRSPDPRWIEHSWTNWGWGGPGTAGRAGGGGGAGEGVPFRFLRGAAFRGGVSGARLFMVVAERLGDGKKGCFVCAVLVVEDERGRKRLETADLWDGTRMLKRQFT